MICLLYHIFLFNLGCFLIGSSSADSMEFIAEKRQREGIMETLRPITPNGCVEECEHKSTCYAVNFFRLNATCQLLNRTMPESKLIKATKCLYKAVKSPPQDSIENDPCYKRTCPWDEICYHNKATNSAECYPLCRTPPVRSGTISDRIELEVGQNYTYICHAGLVAKGGQNPTVTCLPDGSWTSTSFSCVCKTPTKPGAINDTAEVEVGQNYTYKCQDGFFKKGDLNPTITCLQNGSWTSRQFLCVKQNWKQDTINLNNIHRSLLLRNLTGTDLLECMQQCDDTENNYCQSFFYDNQTSQCILSSSFQRGLPQDFKFSDGLVYYTAPSTLCDMEYKNVILGGSYFCIKYHFLRKTFNDAMESCESEKAKLLVITTQTEIHDLKQFVGSIYNCIFVGVTDAVIEGTWLHWNGDKIDIFWNIGEPNGGRAEDCGAIFSGGVGVFDILCTLALPYVCHRNNL